jgi:hypothetical protein
MWQILSDGPSDRLSGHPRAAASCLYPVRVIDRLQRCTQSRVDHRSADPRLLEHHHRLPRVRAGNVLQPSQVIAVQDDLHLKQTSHRPLQLGLVDASYLWQRRVLISPGSDSGHRLALAGTTASICGSCAAMGADRKQSRMPSSETTRGFAAGVVTATVVVVGDYDLGGHTQLRVLCMPSHHTCGSSV